MRQEWFEEWEEEATKKTFKKLIRAKSRIILLHAK